MDSSPQVLYSFPDANPHPVLTCHGLGHLTYCNQAAEQLVAKLELKSALELLPAEHLKIKKTCLDSNQPTSAEVTIKDQVIVWSYRPIEGEAAVYIYGVDITEHKRSTTPVLNDLPLDTLNQLATGIMAVDQNLKVLFVNRAAEDLFSSDSLSIQEGYLVCNIEPLRIKIHQIVSETCLKSTAPAAVSIPRPDKSALEILISPLACDNQSAAVVYLFDSRAPRKSMTQMLMSIYSLTSAEAKLVGLLAAGQSLESARTTLNISKQTAKNQLQAAYKKTGTHRQAELVIRILSGAAGAIH